ncbi:MAG: CRISPR-associated protein Cas4 [Phycisphaerae bacterium]|nr:CRISPR-associated protein Cas4 [Phycisphaerae bacterium]
MYSEDDLIQLSALQHFVFCPRQWALIHLEQVWDENRLTAEGRILHERVHEEDDESRPGVRIVRGLRIHSFRLGLIGQADVVEFYQSDSGVEMPGIRGRWQLYPVEYKRGRPKPDHSDRVQLCAQAMCLEEMLHCTIPQGAFYYGQPRRRQEIELSDELRHQTEDAAIRIHELFDSRITPKARYEKKCDNCSLVHQCMPKTTGPNKKIDLYLEKSFEIPSEDIAP